MQDEILRLEKDFSSNVWNDAAAVARFLLYWIIIAPDGGTIDNLLA